MNKKTISFFSMSALMAVAFLLQSFILQQGPETWSAKQLLAPADLAKQLNSSKTKTYVYNIGPAGHIKNSVDIGEGRDSQNIARLKQAVSKLPKDANIVVYCGCCPFKNCPNVRPAFKLLTDMNFTNHKLLNLSQNLKVDWIDKGYPMKK